MSDSRQSTHFLTYEQTGEWDISLGETSLYYTIGQDQLIVTSKYSASSMVSSDFKEPLTKYHKELQKEHSDINRILKEFLIDYLSKIRYGHPWYVYSETFSQKEFDDMLDSAIELIRLRKEKASLNTSEITDVCVEYQMRPEPVDDKGTAWMANCPSRRGHWIHISSKQNLWYCGYCKRNGGIKELVEWIEEVKAKPQL
jgi:hypothetical protein